MTHLAKSIEHAWRTVPLWKLVTLTPAFIISILVTLILLIPFSIGAGIVWMIRYFKGEEQD